MGNTEQSIVLVLHQYSVVVKGFERKLNELGYHVEVLAEDYDRIDSMAANAQLFVFYLPADIMEDSLKKNHLDKMVNVLRRLHRNMIVIGEAKYHSELVNDLPLISDYTWFDRPVDMKAFSDTVDRIFLSGAAAAVQKNILIVDDDPAYAAMVREWIKDSYKVDVVTAGMQAITFLTKKKVDMILLDYEMPIADGPQVLRMLRQEPSMAGIPVIFLTGNGTKEAVTRVMELKPEGYLLKSTTRENLLEFLMENLK